MAMMGWQIHFWPTPHEVATKKVKPNHEKEIQRMAAGRAIYK